MPAGYAARHALTVALADRDGSHACFYCGGHANSVDHVRSKWNGGSDGIDNLVLACWSCNDEKNTLPGWLFVLRKIDAYKWPDPFVKPLPPYELTYSESALRWFTERGSP